MIATRNSRRLLATRRSVTTGISAIGAALGASCGPNASSKETKGENRREPWNSPLNVAAAERLPPPVHGTDVYDSGPALSPDGSLIAFTDPRHAVNLLSIVESGTRRGWTIAHPNYRVKLAHPTFSPDGEFIAFVVTPPTYFGLSEIWIAPLRGGACRVLGGAASSCFLLPTFSPDGARIACFGDASFPFASAGPRSGREYRTGLLHVGLFEIDIASKEIVRIGGRAWVSANYLGYDARNSGFFCSTGLPSHRVTGDNGTEQVGQRGSDPAERLKYDASTGFFLSRAQPDLETPASIIPDQIVPAGTARAGRAALIGADRQDGLLFRVSRASDLSRSKVTSGLMYAKEGVVRDAMSASEAFLSDGCISSDGDTVAAFVSRLFASSGERFIPPDERLIFIRQKQAEVQRFLASEIAYASQSAALEASDTSELAK